VFRDFEANLSDHQGQSKLTQSASNSVHDVLFGHPSLAFGHLKVQDFSDSLERFEDNVLPQVCIALSSDYVCDWKCWFGIGQVGFNSERPASIAGY
jgi:hypothetical protein